MYFVASRWVLAQWQVSTARGRRVSPTASLSPENWVSPSTTTTRAARWWSSWNRRVRWPWLIRRQTTRARRCSSSAFKTGSYQYGWVVHGTVTVRIGTVRMCDRRWRGYDNSQITLRCLPCLALGSDLCCRSSGNTRFHISWLTLSSVSRLG